MQSNNEKDNDNGIIQDEKEARKQKLLFIFSIILIVVIAILLVAFICRTLFPGLDQMFKDGYDEEKVEDFLRHEAGWKGMVALALLQFIQVVSIFIAGAPIQIAGGMIYGFWISFLITHITFVATNWLVFSIARKHNEQATKIISFSSKKAKKVTKWLNSSNPAYMCMLAYMMPGIPNGIVPYVAEKTDITNREFFMAVYLGSFGQIFAACFIGRRILEGDIFWTIAVIIIMILIIVILYRLKNPIIAWINKHHGPGSRFA